MQKEPLTLPSKAPDVDTEDIHIARREKILNAFKEFKVGSRGENGNDMIRFMYFTTQEAHTC